MDSDHRNGEEGDAIEGDHDDVGDQEEEDEDVDHPGAVVLPLPPVVWPAHHHRVRLHASQPRRLHGYMYR